MKKIMTMNKQACGFPTIMKHLIEGRIVKFDNRISFFIKDDILFKKTNDEINYTELLTCYNNYDIEIFEEIDNLKCFS